MSMKICTLEYLISDSNGLGFAKSWLPRMVSERFAPSTKDGLVDRAPDPIPFIDTDISWTNSAAEPQHLAMAVHRASRTIITSNPNTIVLDDAYSWDVGPSPLAPRPSGTFNGFGGRVKTTRSTDTTPPQFSRLFQDQADWIHYEEIGRIDPGDTVHFRYMCLFSTPGEWRAATQPRHEAYARWVRLRLWAAPMVTGAI
jgi:hypothetical protein